MREPPNVKMVVFDLDGTLYRGEQAIPFASESVNDLRSRGVLVRYLTNNSGQTKQFYQRKLQGMGFRAELPEIYSSATGTLAHLLETRVKTAFIVGMPGLVATLQGGGIRVVNAMEQGNLASSSEEVAEAVVVGICRTLTYELLDGALQQLLKGALYIATNPDSTFPLAEGRIAPGAGSIVAAVSTCSGKTPFVVGKPNPYLVQLVASEAQVPLDQTLVVGDRLDTDIESGRRAGAQTHLVLTGVETTAPEGQSFSPDLRGLLSLLHPSNVH